jgi:polynucleotide 5'-kinase involved in rRNA processing
MMNNESKIISIENYDLIRKENQSKFIKSITQIKYTRIPNKKTKILVIGPISAGKSSLLNRFLNTKLEVGVG